jgi:hypothetical protein
MCLRKEVSVAVARFPSKSQKISKKSFMSLIVISYNLKPVKISYANGRVSVRIFYKNNLTNANSFLSTRFQFLYMDFYILGLPTLYDVLYLNVFYNVVCLGGTIIFNKC